MSKHSLLGPSTLQRRFLCPGSYELESLCKPETTDYAERGTELHKQVAEMLKNGVHHDVTGKDIVSDPLVSRCINIAHTSIMAMDVPDEMVEIKMDLTKVHKLIEKGTIDLLLVEPFVRAHITDWKFTTFPPPTASKNLQLAAYAVGVAKEFELEEVGVTIYLPELDKISRHVYDLKGLVDANNRIQQIVEGCQSAWALLNPSQGACRFCRAWGSCPAALSQCGDLQEPPEESLDSALHQDRMGNKLKKAVIQEGVIKKLKQKAWQMLSAGAEIKGVRLKQIRGKRIWKKDMSVTVLRNWAEDLNKDAEMTIIKQEVLPSPAGLEQVWGKAKAVRERIDSMTEMENKGKRLEVDDESGP